MALLPQHEGQLTVLMQHHDHEQLCLSWVSLQLQSSTWCDSSQVAQRRCMLGLVCTSAVKRELTQHDGQTLMVAPRQAQNGRNTRLPSPIPIRGGIKGFGPAVGGQSSKLSQMCRS